MVPFEVRKRMEGKHTPETRNHQVLEEGDKFQSSILRLDRCFLALPRGDTHLLQALWNDLRLPSVRFAFQEEKATASSQHSVYQGREDRYGH